MQTAGGFVVARYEKLLLKMLQITIMKSVRRRLLRMRVCIYKTDDAPDLTLFLREGLAFPSDRRDHDWFPLKTVTQSELRIDIPEKMLKTGYCVERLGKATISATAPKGYAATERISFRWPGSLNSNKYRAMLLSVFKLRT